MILKTPFCVSVPEMHKIWKFIVFLYVKFTERNCIVMILLLLLLLFLTCLHKREEDLN